jgi:hypothetical protein
MAFAAKFSIINVPDNLLDWPASQTYRSLTLFFCNFHSYTVHLDAIKSSIFIQLMHNQIAQIAI